jgi:hypothetical protein
MIRSKVGPHAPTTARWPSRGTLALVGLALVALAGILIVAALRQAAPPGVATPPPGPSAPVPPRPALTRAEEAYIQALWPIHGDVERSALRVSLGQIFYKADDLGPAELRARLEQALAAYRRADRRLRALEPPASLRRAHDDYLAAVQLFQQSAVEVLRMFEDGSEQHLQAAYPLSLEGSNKIREVGAKFWPHEFPPN